MISGDWTIHSSDCKLTLNSDLTAVTRPMTSGGRVKVILWKSTLFPMSSLTPLSAIRVTCSLY